MIICLIFAGIGTACASDTLRTDSLNLKQKLREYRAPVNQFRDNFYGNPALKYHFRNQSLTELNAGLNQSKQDLYAPQQGKGSESLGFEADAFLKHTGKDALWGSASYQNGKRFRQRWNESSDYLTIYPYLTADSVGGDLSFETYTFSGGYSLKLKQTTLGISGSYKAGLEYRNIDPRPKNITSNLEIELGISQQISNSYELAIGGNYRKYSQDNQVKFYSQLGGPAIYHLVGLGVDNKLLAGNKLAAFYDGEGYGLQAQLVPGDKTGFFSSVSYQHFSFNKVITTLLSIPVAVLNSEQLNGEIAYLLDNNGQQYGLKASFFKEERNGIETKFDNRGQGNYVKIASNKNYRNDRTTLRLTGIYGWAKDQQTSWNFMTDLGWSAQDTHYVDPERQMKIAALTAGIQTTATTQIGHSILQLNAGFVHSKNTNKERYWPDLNTSASIYQMLEADFAYLSSGYQQLRLTVNWDYPLKNKMGLSFKSGWTYTTFDAKHKGNQLTLTAGITF